MNHSSLFSTNASNLKTSLDSIHETYNNQIEKIIQESVNLKERLVDVNNSSCAEIENKTNSVLSTCNVMNGHSSAFLTSVTETISNTCVDIESVEYLKDDTCPIERNDFMYFYLI